MRGVHQNLREGTAPPCRGAGPTGLRGFTPTGTHIKYVFVDVRPLRRFAPPPLQGGGVYFGTPSFVHHADVKVHVPSLCPCGLNPSQSLSIWTTSREGIGNLRTLMLHLHNSFPVFQSVTFTDFPPTFTIYMPCCGADISTRPPSVWVLFTKCPAMS